MFTRKTLIASALALILIAVPLASAYAAPVSAAITGTVLTITQNADTSVTITYDDGSGTTQTATFSQTDATTLGLLNPDGTVNTSAIGQPITFDSSQDVGGETNPCVAPTGGDTTGGTTTTSTGEETTGETTSLNLVGQALVNFFCESVGLDSATLQTYRNDGVGYGVIAQACFMAQLSGGDCSSVLDAKLNNDYTGLFPDGSVTNWGQLRKAVFGGILGKGAKSAYNLGAIMSGRAVQPEDGTGTVSTESDSGRERGKGNGGGRGNSGNNGNHGKP